MMSQLWIVKREIIENCKEKIIDIYGWSGSILIILAYAMTTMESTKKITIDVFNLYGSSAMTLICYRQKVWQPMILEIVWFVFSLNSLFRNLDFY